MSIVNMYLAEKDNLDSTLPSSIVIGPFHVNIEDVKQNLSEKYKALATSMLDILAKHLHLQVENVSYLLVSCPSASEVPVFVKWPKESNGGRVNEDTLKIASERLFKKTSRGEICRLNQIKY